MSNSPALDNPILKNGVLKDGEKLSESKTKFPIEVFPKDVQDIIIDLNTKGKYPIDYIAGSMLSAISTAIGNTHICRFDNDKIDNAMLWICLIGDSGTNKTRSISKIFEPIAKRDFENYKAFESQFQEYELNGCEGKRPTFKRLTVKDSTPEALIKTLYDNPRGLIANVDELRNWYGNFNRYNSGSIQSWYLQIHSQVPIDYIRQKKTIKVERPFYNVLGGLQPSLIYDLAKGDNLVDGFIYRFLFFYPEGLEYPKWELNKESTKPSFDKWNRILNRVLDLEYDEITERPKSLDFDPLAQKSVLEYQNKCSLLVNQKNEPILKSIQAKLDSALLRLSLVLEGFYHGNEQSSFNTISVESVNGAIKLCDFFRDNIIKVITKAKTTRKNETLKDQLYSKLDNQFTTAEAEKVCQELGLKRSAMFKNLSNEDDYIRVSEGVYKKAV